MDKDKVKSLLADRELWKLVAASVIGGLVVAWLGPLMRRIPPK